VTLPDSLPNDGLDCEKGRNCPKLAGESVAPKVNADEERLAIIYRNRHCLSATEQAGQTRKARLLLWRQR
jgi:hypothetical protein